MKQTVSYELLVRTIMSSVHTQNNWTALFILFMYCPGIYWIHSTSIIVPIPDTWSSGAQAYTKPKQNIAAEVQRINHEAVDQNPNRYQYFYKYCTRMSTVQYCTVLYYGMYEYLYYYVQYCDGIRTQCNNKYIVQNLPKSYSANTLVVVPYKMPYDISKNLFTKNPFKSARKIHSQFFWCGEKLRQNMRWPTPPTPAMVSSALTSYYTSTK